MKPQLASRTAFALLASTAVAAIWFAVGDSSTGSARPVSAPPEPTAAAQPAAKDRKDDQAAIQKKLDSFAGAFQKNDSKAIAAHWTAEGEYISEDGTTFKGRVELEKAYAEFFSKNSENALEVEIETIRFPSRDNAVVEGHFKRHTGKKKELVVSKCSLLMAREDGNWLIVIAREWPSDGLALRDLEWLIGTWEATRDGTVVRTTYEWTKNKTFIRCNLSITHDGKTVTAMQMIGKMPSTGGLHIWTFEDEGGIGDADITREGKKWFFAARGSTADGQVIVATNIMMPVDADSFTWQTVERTADGEQLSDLPPVKVTRVKGKK